MNMSNEIKPQWSAREYREGDEDRILELRGISLSDSRDIRWWQWMFQNGPAGPALIWLADNGQKIVGHHALLPLRVKISEGEHKCCLGFDVMTHPDYQRQGILSKLRAKIYESAAENDIRFSLGSATPQIFPVYSKLGSFFICEPPLLVKTISLGKVLKSRFGIPAFIGTILGYPWERLTGRTSSLQDNDIEIERVLSFDDTIDSFWLKASEIKKIMIIRDMKYLNWRYVEKPGDEYIIFVARRRKEIVGYIVLKIQTGPMIRGLIIDILTLPGENAVAERLITRATEYLRGEGVAMISCMMLRDTPYYATLRKLGFMRRSSGVLFGACLIGQDLPKEILADPGNWYYTWGDSDTR